jgi:anti-anti-sigma factor
MRAIPFPRWHSSLPNVTGDSDEQCGATYNRAMQTQETLQVEPRPGTAPDTRVMKLAGSLTLSCCYAFQDQLRADNSRCLILDMTEVKFVDSSGIGCLVNGYIAHHMAGGRLVLAGVNKRIRETLEETRVQQFFTLYDTVEQAEKELAI